MDLTGLTVEDFVACWSRCKPERTAKRLKAGGYGAFSPSQIVQYERWLHSQGVDLKRERDRLQASMRRLVLLITMTSLN